jgi:hypothetical protein
MKLTNRTQKWTKQNSFIFSLSNKPEKVFVFQVGFFFVQIKWTSARKVNFTNMILLVMNSPQRVKTKKKILFQRRKKFRPNKQKKFKAIKVTFESRKKHFLLGRRY